MLINFLRIRDDTDIARLLQAAGNTRRALASLDSIPADAFGSDIAPSVFARSIAASTRMASFSASASQVEAMLAGEPTTLDPLALNAVRGVADAMRAVLDHPGDLPLSESQLKYLQSLLLRHEPTAAPFRRQYRREGDDAAGIPAAVAELVAWTKDSLEPPSDGRDRLSPSEDRLSPFLVIAVFGCRLLEIRPFEVGTGRLVRTVFTQLLARYGYDFLEREPLEERLADRLEAFATATVRGDAVGWIAAFLDAFADCADAVSGRFEHARPAQPGRVSEDLLLTPRQERVAAAMRERGAAKIGDLLQSLSIPRATLKKDLRYLVDSGLLSMTGTRKGTVYRVLPAPHPAD